MGFYVALAVQVLGFAIDCLLVGLVNEAFGFFVARGGFLLELVNGAVLECVTDSGEDSSSECDGEVEKCEGERECDQRVGQHLISYPGKSRSTGKLSEGHSNDLTFDQVQRPHLAIA